MKYCKTQIILDWTTCLGQLKYLFNQGVGSAWRARTSGPTGPSQRPPATKPLPSPLCTSRYYVHKAELTSKTYRALNPEATLSRSVCSAMSKPSAPRGDCSGPGVASPHQRPSGTREPSRPVHHASTQSSLHVAPLCTQNGPLKGHMNIDFT